MKKAVVSFSGGMDSTCLVLKLLSEGYEVRAYSFDYGQTHNIELKLAKKNIRYLRRLIRERRLGCDVTHQIINLRDVFNDSTSCLCTHETAPSGDYKSETMKSTVVENRNVIFSSIIYAKALAWANSSKDSVLISLGVHAGDHSIYPDCTPESVNMARELFRISNWGSERVSYDTPFVNIDKAHVLRAGLDAMESMGFDEYQINTILKNTNSCYNNTNGEACGTCGTCIERLEAFALNDMRDPIKYKH